MMTLYQQSFTCLLLIMLYLLLVCLHIGLAVIQFSSELIHLLLVLLHLLCLGLNLTLQYIKHTYNVHLPLRSRVATKVNLEYMYMCTSMS